MINDRQERILSKLISSLLPLSFEELHQGEEISERTLRYDLSAIKTYLISLGVKLQNRREVGYYLDLNDKQIILKQINSNNDDIRRKKDVASILVEYLNDSEKNIQQLSNDLFVSETGTRNIIKDAEDRFSFLIRGRYPWKIKNEYEFREEIIKLLIELIETRNEYSYESIKQYFGRYINEEKFNQIKFNLTRSIQEFHIWISVNAFNELLLYLLVTYIRNGKHFEKNDINIGDLNSKFLFETKFCKKLLKKSFNIEEETEIKILLKFVVHSGIFIDTDIENISQDLHRTVDNMLQILRVSDSSIQFDSENLKYDLIRHLNQFIKKKSVGFVEEDNLLLSQIKNNYPHHYRLANEMYKEFMKDYDVSDSESEISFIAVYLYKNSEVKKEKRYKVIAVCGTGRGMSLLMKKRIENVFDNIDVIECYSSIQVQTLSQFDEVDFIVSTINLELNDIDVLAVSAFLGNRDIRVIQEYLNYGASYNEIPVQMGWDESSKKNLETDLIHSFSKNYQKVFLRLLDCLMALPNQYKVDEQAILGITIHLILAIPRIIESRFSDEGKEELNAISINHPEVYTRLDEFFNYFESKMDLKMDPLERYAIFQYIIKKEIENEEGVV